jgi:integrase
MKFVEPIREKNKIRDIKLLLRSKWKIRELFLFQLWLVTALRMWDMLELKIKDIANDDLTLLSSLVIKEQKTWKTNTSAPTKNLKTVRAEYKEAYPTIVANRDNYVFFRSKSRTWAIKWTENISVKQWWRIITSACIAVWLQWSYSSHSLRKTYGYQSRMHKVPIEKIQKKLNHSSPWVTLDYIGITQEELDNINHEMDL